MSADMTRRERRERRARRRVLATSAVSALAVLATAGIGVAHAHREVTLSVDGVTMPVSGFFTSVADVLDAANVAPGEHDLVAPDPGANVSDGSSVVVRTAKAYTLRDATGKERVVWSTGNTAASVLAADSGLIMAADRSMTRDNLDLAAPGSDARVVADGEVTTVTVRQGDTIPDLLDRAGVSASAIDRVSMTRDNRGLSVTVTRVVRETVNVKTPIPRKTTEHDDPKLPKGKKKVTAEGHDGEKVDSYYQEKVGDETTVRAHTGTTTVAPKDREVAVGTYVAPKPTPAPAEVTDTAQASTLSAAAPAAVQVPAGSSQAIAQSLLAARGWSGQWSQFNALVTRESGWNVSATNASSGAYGLPQALPGSKMASHGSDWRTNPATQLAWMMDYIAARYGDPAGAWAHSQATGWY